MAFSVEKLACLARRNAGERAFIPDPGGRGALHRDCFGHFAQVLGGGGEVELFLCAMGTAQAQAVQLEDALEMANSILTFFRWCRETR